MQWPKMYYPRIKICGITRFEDAVAAARHGADAVGFVFVPNTKRYITPEKARAIIQQLPPLVMTVGVFMDDDPNRVRDITAMTGVDRVQLHGHESPEYCRQINGRIIKRFHISPDENAKKLMEKMTRYPVSGYLLDPGAGDGQTFDWQIVRNISLPVIVAGGLNPDNVSELISQVKPMGVDVSSGVELSPGIKDPEKIRNFVRNVRRAI